MRPASEGCAAEVVASARRLASANERLGRLGIFMFEVERVRARVVGTVKRGRGREQPSWQVCSWIHNVGCLPHGLPSLAPVNLRRTEGWSVLAADTPSRRSPELHEKGSTADRRQVRALQTPKGRFQPGFRGEGRLDDSGGEGEAQFSGCARQGGESQTSRVGRMTTKRA